MTRLTRLRPPSEEGRLVSSSWRELQYRPCSLVEFADMWALRMGSAARASARLKKRRVCRASKGVYNLSDGMLLRRQLHSPCTTSTHHQSTRWMRRAGRTEEQVGEKLIADRWIRQTNFDVEIIYGIGVGRGDDDIAISLRFLDTSRDAFRKDTRKDGSPCLFLDAIFTQSVNIPRRATRRDKDMLFYFEINKTWKFC